MGIRKKRQSDGDLLSNESSSFYWLDEDKEWGTLRQNVAQENFRKQKNGRNKSSAFEEPVDDETQKVEVNIKLALPRINYKRLQKRLTSTKSKIATSRRKFNAKWALGLAAIPLTVVIIVVINAIFFKDEFKDSTVSGSNVVQDENGVTPPTTDPKFDFVQPEGRPIEKSKIAYDSVRNFAKYDDEINGIPITVSQQPMPSQYKNDLIGGAKKIAGDFGATEELSVDGQLMYLGKDEKGPMTLILTKNEILIFILTSKQIDKNGLMVYASNLN